MRDEEERWEYEISHFNGLVPRKAEAGSRIPYVYFPIFHFSFLVAFHFDSIK